MRPVLALHGGAGGIRPRSAQPCRQALRRALEAGYAMLLRGASGLDTVTAVVMLLEDSGLFNAGRGAERNADGGVELDASVMDGRGLRAGGVAAVSRVRNPVLAARAVMEKTPHVLLVGDGAEKFCRSRKLKIVGKSYFVARKRSSTGTVGAVALDRRGHLAAATSTGGYWGKLAGRVGDSPLAGAGTWADDRSCAVSCTGIGEYFIRTAAAFQVSARMLYGNESIAVASRNVLLAVKKLKGYGGLIAVDRRGNVVLPYNSAGMYRAWVARDGRLRVAL